MSDAPKYPDIEIPLTGEDGNVFFIIGRCTRAMRQAGLPQDEVKAFNAEMMSGDYDHALRTVMAWFSVVVSDLQCPRKGKWFGGCHFEARYDEVPGSEPSEISAASPEAIRAILYRCVYVRDVCTSCGATVERKP